MYPSNVDSVAFVNLHSLSGTDSTDSADSTEQAGAAAPDAAPGAVHEGAPWGTPSEAAVERVLKCVAIVKGEAGAQGSDEWHSLGLDSMAAVQLFSQVIRKSMILLETD